MHSLGVIVTLAGALAFALVLGWTTQRLGLSTLVGYMVAGIVVGPNTPGFVADTSLASQMAEIGVILLMFGVGMHFHPQELLRVRRVAIPGAVAQSAVAVLAGWGAARALGWTNAAGLVLGMALAVASTVVLMKMLVEQDRLNSHDGHVAVGWLIVEDLFTVVALVLLPTLALENADGATMALAVGKALGLAALFGALVWLLGTRLTAPLMERVARTRSAELFTLTVFVVALGVALIAAEVFHVSVALGAFFAGLVVGQSRFGPQAAADMAPFRDVFTALFFVSVGMLFDPLLLVREPLLVAVALAIVLLVKPAVALAIVLALREPPRTALVVAVGLAQIGEFSFILAALGESLGILPKQGMGVLVVAAIVSIAVNPLLFRLLARYEATRVPAIDGEDEPVAAPASTLASAAPVAITGAAEVGRRFVERCANSGFPVCVIDPSVEALEALRRPWVETVFGDAGRADVLSAAGVREARMIVVTNAELTQKMRVCIAARALNPHILIVATAGTAAERAWLQEFGVASVVDAMDEMADALLRAVRQSL
jgi:CPA2 family monovalent cation:H+ antiporter-2